MVDAVLAHQLGSILQRLGGIDEARAHPGEVAGGRLQLVLSRCARDIDVRHDSPPLAGRPVGFRLDAFDDDCMHVVARHHLGDREHARARRAADEPCPHRIGDSRMLERRGDQSGCPDHKVLALARWGMRAS